MADYSENSTQTLMTTFVGQQQSAPINQKQSFVPNMYQPQPQQLNPIVQLPITLLARVAQEIKATDIISFNQGIKAWLSIKENATKWAGDTAPYQDENAFCIQLYHKEINLYEEESNHASMICRGKVRQISK